MTTDELFSKLSENYLKGDKGICQISRENNVNLSTFRKWLRKNNLQRTKEQSYLLSGERFRRRYENKILELYDQKWFLKDIALKCGISQNSVSKIIRNNGIKVNKMTRFRPNNGLGTNMMMFEPSKEEISNDFHSLSLSEVAQKYGVAKGTARKYARVNNIKYKTHWSIEREHITASYMMQDIKNMAEIARELKNSQNYVKKVLKEASLKVPKRGQWRLGIGSIGKNETKIRELYEKGATLSFLHKKFGCDKRDLQKWIGSRWNLQIRKHDRKAVICDDGHKVRSNYEREIDNWLFHNRILHQVDGRIQGIDRKIRYDFKIEDIFVEYWGLLAETRFGNIYRQKMIEKIKIYKENQLKLINIFPKDDFRQKLSFLLKHSQIQTSLGDYQ